MNISWAGSVASRGACARPAGFALAATLALSAFARADEPYRFDVLNSRSDMGGFAASGERDYDDYRAFYKTTVVQSAH